MMRSVVLTEHAKTNQKQFHFYLIKTIEMVELEF